MSQQKLIVGNWKMNGGLSANQTLLDEIKTAINQIITLSSLPVLVQ